MVNKDIFLSYNSSDKDFVTIIKNKIEDKGCLCWFQLDDSKQDFALEIFEGIKNSICFIVFLSKNSIKSSYVRSEISIAFKKYNKNKDYKILPIILEDIFDMYEYETLDLYLSCFNQLDARNFDYDMLVDKIYEQLNIPLFKIKKFNNYQWNTKNEEERILYQNNLLLKYSKKFFELDTLKNRKRILDVGCSNGYNIVNMIKGCNYNLLIGIDKNNEAIEMAKSNFENEKNKFYVMDFLNQNFYNDILKNMNDNNINSFDLITISSVLLHLEDSSILLKLLYKLLDKDGIIFIEDEDDGYNIVDPPNAFFDDCFYMYQESFQAGDRHMGRKLPRLLVESGFKNIQILRDSISSEDFNGEYKEELWDLYFNPFLWNATTPEMFRDIRAFEKLDNYKKLHNKIKGEYLLGNYFISLGIFFLLATK